MFRACLAKMERHANRKLDRFRYYVERHIEVDGDSHGLLARRMMLKLCGDDPARHREAIATASAALRARIALWDGVRADFEPAFSRGVDWQGTEALRKFGRSLSSADASGRPYSRPLDSLAC